MAKSEEEADIEPGRGTVGQRPLGRGGRAMDGEPGEDRFGIRGDPVGKAPVRRWSVPGQILAEPALIPIRGGGAA